MSPACPLNDQGADLQVLTLSPSFSNCEHQQVTAPWIDRKRKAEATHIQAKDPRRREKSARDWKGSPPGCWNFYDLLMSHFVAGRDAPWIENWIRHYLRAGEFIGWLFRKKLLAVEDDKLIPLPDPRPKKSDNEWAAYPGWKKCWGDPTEGGAWEADEGMAILLPLVVADIACRQRRSRAGYARMMQWRAKQDGRHGISRAMVGNWLKMLQGYRREKIPGTKNNMWAYEPTLAKIHIAEEGFSFRHNHQWAWHPPLYAEGPDPENIPPSPVMLAWVKGRGHEVIRQTAGR